MNLITELRRRNVFRVGIAYLVTAWLVAQIADVVLGVILAPDWVMQALVLLLALGFPFALIFAWAFELTPEGLKKEKDVDRTRSITHVTGRKLDFTIIGVLVVALAYFAIDKFVLTDPIKGAESLSPADPSIAAADDRATGALTPSSTPARSIAVLPFVNMSEDASNEYFSDGISEEILNALARVKELKVAGRTSSFAFKGQNQDLREIGEALGVEHILEGSVRKAGTKIRITAQLIQVDDGFHLWSDTYDRELTDVFAIQDEIANAILGELKAQLMGTEPVEVAATRTNAEAYELYLLAKQRMYERTGPTIESAGKLLDRAIAIDPGYAPAYAQRGIVALLLSEGTGTYGNIPRQESLSQGRLYIDKALELDPELAEAWAGLGLYYVNQPTGWDRAVEPLQKALALNPGLIDASNWLHNVLMAVGRPAEGRQVVLDLAERDPLYRPGIRNTINALNWFGQQDMALAHLERIRPLIPNDAVLQSSEAAIHASLGQFADALRLSESAVALQPSNSVARLTRSFTWLDTHQYDRAAEDGEEWHPIIALFHLGRTEEAALLAYKRAEEIADVGVLFSFLNMAGRSGELVRYLEERWASLDALRADFPPYGGLGDFLMLDVALAYSRVGNAERFEAAMRHAELTHRRLQEQGIDNRVFDMSEAARLALAGDFDASLEWAERAVDRGLIASTRIARDWPMLAPLEGDPRFEALQNRMIEHLNRERTALGLDPLNT